jgi:hypothetical protein
MEHVANKKIKKKHIIGWVGVEVGGKSIFISRIGSK